VVTEDFWSACAVSDSAISASIGLSSKLLSTKSTSAACEYDAPFYRIVFEHRDAVVLKPNVLVPPVQPVKRRRSITVEDDEDHAWCSVNVKAEISGRRHGLTADSL
jgi:hypothetical protein